MKKIISNEEIIEKAKKWIASFTHDEFSKMLKEEIYLSELNEVKNLEWLSKDGFPIRNDFPRIECEATIIKDKRRFTWTLSNTYSNTKESCIPNFYVEFFLEAA